MTPLVLVFKKIKIEDKTKYSILKSKNFYSQNRRKKFIFALAFLVMKIKKNIQSMYQEDVAKKHMLAYY